MIRQPIGSDSANRKNMALLIQMRWIAVAGQILTILFAVRCFNIRLPYPEMGAVLVALSILNIISADWLRRAETVPSIAIRIALVLDVTALTIQLGLSGGAINPFTSLYLLQITLGAVLLDSWAAWSLVVLACFCFVMLMLVYRPLVLPGWEMSDLFSLHVAGSLVCFAVDAALLVILLTRVTHNLRERDAKLAALRQQAAEEDHIVRMGFLATGAAHELGTPLASLAVIIGDWKRVPAIAYDSMLSQELGEMQRAVDRCKSIVSGILMSAGEARGERPTITTLTAFLDDIAQEWEALHAAARLIYRRNVDARRVIADTALKQILFNVLDNAHDISTGRVVFTASVDGDDIVLQVQDSGPGFSEEALARLGTPYQSTKGQGRGLGLFLVVNVVRKFGGTVSAVNLPDGGAVVTIRLPGEAFGDPAGVEAQDE